MQHMCLFFISLMGHSNFSKLTSNNS